jgi:uncharacterized membrane-anchored protein YhcB (DUF1043 family)
VGTGDAESQIDAATDEVSHIEADVEPSDGSTGSWPRTVLTAIVGVLAVVALVAGVLGFWTIRVAANSERFETKTEELLRTEEISDALARRIVSEVASALELSEALDAVVPDILEPTVAVLLAGVRSRVELQLGEQLRQDRFVELVGGAVGTAHSAAVDVIQGDDVVDGVTVVDGQVKVNLLPVVALALTNFQEIGLFPDADIPDLDRTGDPDDQRQQLSTALDRELPEDFGEIVVVTSDSLERAGSTVQRVRDVLVLARRTFWLLLAVGLGFGALAVWLSARRWRSASFLVAGLFAVTLIVRLVVGRARDKLPNVVEQPGARATVDELARGLEQSLNSTLLWVSVSALVVLIATAFVTARYPRPTD